MQSLLGRSRWDADALRDRVRADVIEVLGDRDGVLVVDETGFLKKGEHSVGVARQYSGTAGRIENCQVGVFLAYASRYGQALIDRRLYLPDVWAQDESKRAKAGVPEAITFVTKPQMACALIAAALDAGAPCAWVLADALYGSDSRLRRMLRHGSSPTCLRCAPTTACASGPRRGWKRPTLRRWPMPWRGMPGPRTRPARARRGCGCMSGRGSRCLRPLPRASSTGFGSGAAGGSPTNGAPLLCSRRWASRWGNWPARRGGAGRMWRGFGAPKAVPGAANLGAP